MILVSATHTNPFLHPDLTFFHGKPCTEQATTIRTAMQPSVKLEKFQSVPVGNSGYVSEFILEGTAKAAYIKTSFNSTKKHYTALESAVAMARNEKPHVQRIVRTHISINELLNPMEK